MAFRETFASGIDTSLSTKLNTNFSKMTDGDPLKIDNTNKRVGVGIGGATPASVLTVAHSTASNSKITMGVYTAPSTFVSRMTIGLDDATNCSLNASAGYLRFLTSSVERIRIASTGTVTIPSNYLIIKGGSAMGKLTVTTTDATGGADGDIWFKY